MGLKLKSDFVDYYDHQFDAKGDIYERFSSTASTRADDLKYLADLGWTTPFYGISRNVIPYVITELGTSALHFIVYLNEHAHRGEEKLKVTAEVALERFPDHFVVLYIRPDVPSKSYRFLQIGKKPFILIFKSNDEWRSNCGDVEVRLMREGKDGYHPTIHRPMFAIDYIVANKSLIAVDFNTAPGLKQTGLENVMKPHEVYREIHEAYQAFKKAK